MPPVEVIRVRPVTRWARNKVHEHGELYLVRRRAPGRVCCESLSPTWRGVTWMGWFDAVDAEVEVVTDTVACPRCNEDIDVRELAEHLETCKPVTVLP